MTSFLEHSCPVAQRHVALTESEEISLRKDITWHGVAGITGKTLGLAPIAHVQMANFGHTVAGN